MDICHADQRKGLNGRPQVSSYGHARTPMLLTVRARRQTRSSHLISGTHSRFLTENRSSRVQGAPSAVFLTTVLLHARVKHLTKETANARGEDSTTVSTPRRCVDVYTYSSVEARPGAAEVLENAVLSMPDKAEAVQSVEEKKRSAAA